MGKTGRDRMLLIIAIFCVVPLTGLGFYLMTPTITETTTSQKTLTTDIVETRTSQYTASITYTTSGFTSLCNYFGPPFGCGSLRTAYLATSYSAYTASFTSTQVLVTTSRSEATLPPRAVSQEGGIGAIAAAIILTVVLAASRRNGRSVTSTISWKKIYEQRTTTTSPKPTRFLCHHCGARTPADSTFCEECGQRLQTPEPPRSHARERIFRVGRRGHVPWDGSSTNAEFEGWCPRCHRRIHLGDKITWWKDNDDDVRWIHLKCR